MAQTGYTPISLYYSATGGNAPTSGNLVAGELAINTADGKLFYKDSGGTVQTLATKGTASIGGANNQIQYNSAGNLAGSSNFVFDGTFVGIGCTPTNLLDIFGSNPIRYRANGSTTDAIFYIDTTSTNNAAYLNFGQNGALNQAYVGFGGSSYTYLGGPNALNLWNQINGPVVLATYGTERMRITGAGNVGVGTTNPSTKFVVNGGSGTSQIRWSVSSNAYVEEVITNAAENAYLAKSSDASYHVWKVTSGEQMRLSSGGALLVNTTSYSNVTDGVSINAGSIQQTSNNGFNLYLAKASGAPQTAYVYFAWNTGLVGYINYNGSGVSYNTSSDFRLKNNIQNSPEALLIIKSIKVRSYDWKNHEEHDDFGFVAQELYEIYPKAVSSQKDNEDGSMGMAWGVDYSKLVPVLTKAVQEQQAMIEELKAKVAALEAA